MTELRTAGGSATDPVEALPIVVPAASTSASRPPAARPAEGRPRRASPPPHRDAPLRAAPAANARLTIDGVGHGRRLGHRGGRGLGQRHASQNVIVQNTRDHGIQVDSAGTKVRCWDRVSRCAGRATRRPAGAACTSRAASVHDQPAGNQPARSSSRATPGAGISVTAERRPGGQRQPGQQRPQRPGHGGRAQQRRPGRSARRHLHRPARGAQRRRPRRHRGLRPGHTAPASRCAADPSSGYAAASCSTTAPASCCRGMGAQDFTAGRPGRAGDRRPNILQNAEAVDAQNETAASASTACGPPPSPPSRRSATSSAAPTARPGCGADRTLNFGANCTGGMDVQIPAMPAGVQVDTTPCPGPVVMMPPAPAPGRRRTD